MNQSEKPEIDTALVKRLIAEQFPEWARLPIRQVDSAGTDNAIFRHARRRRPGMRLDGRVDLLDARKPSYISDGASGRRRRLGTGQRMGALLWAYRLRVLPGYEPHTRRNIPSRDR